MSQSGLFALLRCHFAVGELQEQGKKKDERGKNAEKERNTATYATSLLLHRRVVSQTPHLLEGDVEIGDGDKAHKRHEEFDMDRFHDGRRGVVRISVLSVRCEVTKSLVSDLPFIAFP